MIKDHLVGIICPSHCTEVRFASFLSGGFITVIVVNPLELGMYFDAVVVEVKTFLLLFRLSLAILCLGSYLS